MVFGDGMAALVDCIAAVLPASCGGVKESEGGWGYSIFRPIERFYHWSRGFRVVSARIGNGRHRCVVCGACKERGAAAGIGISIGTRLTLDEDREDRCRGREHEGPSLRSCDVTWRRWTSMG